MDLPHIVAGTKAILHCEGEAVDELHIIFVTESGRGVHAIGRHGQEYWLAYEPEGIISFTNETVELECSGWYEVEMEDEGDSAFYADNVYKIVPIYSLQ